MSAPHNATTQSDPRSPPTTPVFIDLQEGVAPPPIFLFLATIALAGLFIVEATAGAPVAKKRQ